VEFGVVRGSEWDTIAGLGVDFVEFLVRPSTADGTILAGLDRAQAMGLKVLLHVYDSATDTDAPWSPEVGITPRGAEILRLVEGHPALWAVYAFEEPFDYTSEGYVTPDEQRELYAAIKAVADVPVYSDMASLARAESEGLDLSEGMCDVCCVAPTHWPDDPTPRLLAEVDTWRRTMPGAELAVMVNVYEALPNYVLPTAGQLRDLRATMCELGLDYLYYPWSHGGYTTELKDLPDLWPVIAEGCGGATPPAPTDTPPPIPPTDTPARPTDTAVPPTDTPQASGATIINHSAYAADLTLAQLDEARARVSYFTHKSIGNNILDGMADLQALDPARYSITIRYSTGVLPGLNQYQVGSNGNPPSKIGGFVSTVKDGHELAFMKFCVGDWVPFSSYVPINVWPQYRDAIRARANTVWWTLPLTSESDGRGLAGFAEFNAAVRRYVAQNGGVLFDLADIESDGGRCQRAGVEALCDEWTSDGAHLNEAGRQRVASALWVLLATER